MGRTDKRLPCSISFSWAAVCCCSACSSPTSGSAIGSEEVAMTLDYALGGALAALLLVYLTVALARPEKF